MGAPLVLQNPLLSGLRKWAVKEFENHLIFYPPHRDRISIIRVLHAARDWWAPPMAKLCRWFEVPRCTVYNRPPKAAPKIQEQIVVPIKAMIEENPSFG